MLIIRHEIGKEDVIEIGAAKIKIRKSGEKCVKIYIDAPKDLQIKKPMKRVAVS